MTGSMNARVVDRGWRPVVGIASSARRAGFGDRCVVRGSLLVADGGNDRSVP